MEIIFSLYLLWTKTIQKQQELQQHYDHTRVDAAKTYWMVKIQRKVPSSRSSISNSVLDISLPNRDNEVIFNQYGSKILKMMSWVGLAWR